MKRNFGILSAALALVTVVFFTSCEDDNDIDDNVVVVTFDCEELEADQGDACAYLDSAGVTVFGIVDSLCFCVLDYNPPVFDCPDLQANVGDVCWSQGGNNGVVTEDCDCEYVGSEWDCPEYQANYGDACTNDSLNIIGTLDTFCNCVDDVDPVFDCPDLQSNIGDLCTVVDGAGNVTTGFVDADCECNAQVFDCPDWGANIGDEIWDDGTGTLILVGYLDADCNLQAIEYDCPDLQLNVGDSCIYYIMNEIFIGNVTPNCVCD